MKELLKSDSICESYAEMKKGPVFLTHSVDALDVLYAQLTRNLFAVAKFLLTRLLTNSEEDFEGVSELKEAISSTVCELKLLILSMSVTFNVTFNLTAASLIKGYST